MMSTDQTPIPPVTRDDPAAHSGDMVARNVEALKALFPSIVTDGKVDFDVLRQLLGDAVEEGAERYGLNWKGKARARAFALTPSLGTLRPAKEDSKDWDTTKNIMIEGDNLEVLKLLRKSYAGKVKLIYIDPPYNTGKDFVYPDDYSDSLANYEALTGQRGDDGARLISNKETSGRFHTDWLNMMYPRLMLAKELLRDDGVIAVSLDEIETSNIIHILDDIFGQENKIANISWHRKRGKDNSATFFSRVHDNLVIYASSINNLSINKLPLNLETRSAYSNRDNDPRGDYRMLGLWARGGQGGSRYEFTNLRGETFSEREWLVGKDTMQQLDKDNKIIYIGDKLYRKLFLSENNGVIPDTIWTGLSNNANAADELKNIFGVGNIFSGPKPTPFIRRIIYLFTSSNDLVIDFFAGSGTTAQAVLEENAANEGARRYTLVQLPELLDPKKAEQKSAAEFCDKLGKPRTIAELTKERLRRAGAKVQAEHPNAKLDTGFRVYKLATSNLKPWQPGDDLARDLLAGANNVLEGRGEDDLMVELMLKTGIDLTIPGETRDIAGRTVHLFGGGTLVVCLADIPAAVARAMGDGIADWLDEVAPPAPTTFFFKDSGFDADGSGPGPRSAEARANLAATLRQRLGEDAIEKLGAI